MIFYFSATGNSKKVARVLAERTGERMVDMTQCRKTGNLTFRLEDEERLGFVFATHHWGVPQIVKEFIRALRLENYHQQYCYMVATYGTSTGGVHRFFQERVTDKGIRLDGAFCVGMVDIWTPIFDLSDKEKNLRITREAETKMAHVAALVEQRQPGRKMHMPIPVPLARLYHRTYERARLTAHFHVTDDCVGCGLCAKRCPMGVIAMEEGYPKWTQERCTICLSCLHHCPKFAIRYGKNSASHGQFVHPEENK